MLLQLSLISAVFGAPTVIDVDPSTVTHEINKGFMGCHSDSGYTHEPRGFYAQMVLGESFEVLPPAAAAASDISSPSILKATSLKNAANGGLVRHCSFDLYSDTGPAAGPDFLFNVVAALDGTASAVSLQSINFPAGYIAVDANSGVERGRLGVVQGITSAELKANASFTMKADPKNASQFMLVSHSQGSLQGHYVSINSQRIGACAGTYSETTFDVVLLPPSSSDLSGALWSYDHAVPPGPPPTFKYTAWSNYVSSTNVDAGFTSDAANPFHGKNSQKIMYYSSSSSSSSSSKGTPASTAPATSAGGGGVAGVANRGLGSEGLFVEAGKDYDGYFFAKSDKPVTLVAQFVDKRTNATLGSATIPFAGGNWTQINFTFTTTAGSECVDGSNDPTVTCGGRGPGAGHVCVSCGAQFVVGLAQPGTVNIDFVYVQPGEWGRHAGLGVLKSGVDVLKDMGISLIRLGGSFTDPDYYFWKRWIGKPWERPSVGAEWGRELISGWGPFEFIDMCNAADIVPVMTTTGVCEDCTPGDMADLIDYCHGGAETVWGARRIADGHPHPYNVTTFELGNEQYNPMYADQVTEMEARAVKLGMGKTMYYMNPNNAAWLHPDDAAKVEKVGIKDHAVMDEHVGGGGGVEIAKSMFTKYPNYTMGAVNAETNAAIHTMSRALMEATDLNDWFNCKETWCSRLHFRTASFCTERSGHFDGFDQGISFFLPNMTWIQPPGYVHKMIADTWSSKAISVTMGGGAAACEYYAWYSDKGCRNWPSGPCTEQLTGGQPNITLHKRSGGVGGSGVSWPVIGINKYCSEIPIYSDGPDGPSTTDEICKQRCIDGQVETSDNRVSAQVSDDGKTVYIRVSTMHATDITLTIRGKPVTGAVKMTMIHSKDLDGANTPGNPTRISPQSSTLMMDGKDNGVVSLPDFSFTVFEVPSI